MAAKKLSDATIRDLEPEARPYEVRDTEVRGLLVRIEVGGTKSFFLDYRLNGRRNRYRLGVFDNVTVAGARKLAKQLAGEVAGGVDIQDRRKADRAATERAKVSTLGAFLTDRYEHWARAELKSADFQLKRLRSDFAKHLTRPMAGFHELFVEGIRQQWRREGLSPASINRDLQRLQGVLSKAVEWKVLDRHPFSGRLKPLKADKSGRVRFLHPDEEAALRSALLAREARIRAARVTANKWRIARHKAPFPEIAGEFADYLRPMALLSLNTGLRRGELLGLVWGDVSLPSKQLTVRAATAKSGHTRRIPLNAEAMAILSAWKAAHKGAGNADYVFTKGGERLNSVTTAWESVIKASGLHDFHFHDLRHTFASKLVQAGVDLNSVRELMGHSEIKMTLRYAHLAPDGLARAVSKIG